MKHFIKSIFLFLALGLSANALAKSHSVEIIAPKSDSISYVDLQLAIERLDRLGIKDVSCQQPTLVMREDDFHRIKMLAYKVVNFTEIKYQPFVRDNTRYVLVGFPTLDEFQYQYLTEAVFKRYASLQCATPKYRCNCRYELD